MSEWEINHLNDKVNFLSQEINHLKREFSKNDFLLLKFKGIIFIWLALLTECFVLHIIFSKSDINIQTHTLNKSAGESL